MKKFFIFLVCLSLFVLTSCGGGKGGNGTGDGYGGAGGLGGGGYNDVELDDYGTPLGVPESILGGGEVIE